MRNKSKFPQKNKQKKTSTYALNINILFKLHHWLVQVANENYATDVVWNSIGSRISCKSRKLDRLPSNCSMFIDYLGNIGTFILYSFSRWFVFFGTGSCYQVVHAFSQLRSKPSRRFLKTVLVKSLCDIFCIAYHRRPRDDDTNDTQSEDFLRVMEVDMSVTQMIN